MFNTSYTGTPGCDVEWIVETTALCGIWLSGRMVLNVISGVVFYRKSRGTSGYRFLRSLTFCNLLLMIGVIPISVYIKFTAPANLTRIHFTGLFCQLVALGFHAAVGIIMLTVLLIGLDRFLACVGNPLHHSRRMSYTRSLCLISASWCLPVAVLMPLAWQDTHIFFLHNGYCDINWSGTGTAQLVACVYAALTFVLPFIALAAIYIKVFISAKNAASTTRKNFVYEFQNHLGIRRSITVELAKSRSGGDTRLSSGATAERHSFYSSLQAFLTGHDNRKTVQIVIWILLSVLICAFPVYLLMISRAFSLARFDHNDKYQRLVFFLFFVASTICNPFLYIFSNSSLRRDVRRLFMGKAEIRRQCSLQINNGSFRSQTLLQVQPPHALQQQQRSDSRCISTRPSLCMEIASGTPTSAAAASLAASACNHHPAPAGKQLSINLLPNEKEDTRLLMPNHSANSLMGKSSSSRSLSRKSVPFMEEDNPYVGRVAAAARD
ncbi:5-hydroxytryptamine receptor 4-like [Paramacrobiotus metropolitanus]|uniref:5-hydroxytryptamine receptor 4-like n=1 Tax=Paramacrobiotus metropolitanus TaxID=2943436 RepID=UPI00244628BA|nr:5-hydroxytryptamine receptor 4-like [Paramacrobiotus metropolitanus]